MNYERYKYTVGFAALRYRPIKKMLTGDAFQVSNQRTDFVRAIYVILRATCVLLCCFGTAMAQTADTRLQEIWEQSPPFVTQFLSEHYKAELQNWCIEQGDNGLMYFANNAGILQFDGSNWRVIKTERGNPVRSLGKDRNGRIYVGGIGEVGYLEPDVGKGMQFRSLLDDLDPAYRNFGDLWSTYCRNDSVFFIGEHHILIWSDRKFRVITADHFSFFGFSWMIRKQIYVSSGRYGLLRLNRDSLSVARGGEVFPQKGIFALMPSEQNNMLAVGNSKELLLYDGNTVKPFRNANGGTVTLATKGYHGIRLTNGDYVIGTTGSGVYVISKSGELKLNLSQKNGLSSDAIYFVFEDREGDVWLATDNGLTRIELNSPLRILDEKHGVDEATFDIEYFNNTLFRTTAKGLFTLRKARSDRGSVDLFFHKVDQLDHFAQNCHVRGRELLISSQGGVFTLDEASKIEKIYPWYSTVLETPVSPQQNHLFFETARNGIGEIEKIGGKWRVNEERLEINGTAHEMVRGPNGNVFINTRRNGIFEVDWNGKETLKDQYKINFYDTTRGLPSLSAKCLARVGDAIYVSTTKGLYVFDSVNHVFKDVPYVNRYLATRPGSWVDRIVEGKNNSFWLTIDDAYTTHIMKYSNGELTFFIPAGRFANEMITKVYDTKNGIVIFISGKSLILYNEDWQSTPVTNFETSIRKVMLGRDSVISSDAKPASVVKIDFETNDLRFDFALPSYDLSAETQFQYMLQGFDDTWSPWSKQPLASFTNLHEGDYVLKVRAKDIYGVVAQEDDFRFTVHPPWYRTFWAYGSYLIFLVALIALIVDWRSRKLTSETVRLENIVRERTEKIRQQAEELKEMDHVKSTFFANISHEFRTPLTLIIAPIETELRKNPEGNKDALQLVRRSAYRLLELVNQLLDLSKMESGRMELHIRQGSMRHFLSVVASSFESLASQKQINFISRISVPDGDYWYDQDKVEKIITNLLANAFKFTPLEGTVSLDMHVNSEQMLCIEVSDTGAGIPKDEQASIFTAFYQARHAVASHTPGTGLGLSLVKELVKLYKGSISLNSEPGAGTTFVVYIPLDKDVFESDSIFDEAIPTPASEPRISTVPLPDVGSWENESTQASHEGSDTVLIAEDNREMREFMSRTLQENGFTTLAAETGEVALNITFRTIPNLVLTDLMMPEMNGIELTHAIKSDERTSHIPVILLTAKNHSETRLEGLKKGADDYLTKPFSPEELVVRIRNLIDQRKRLAEKFRERDASASQQQVLSLDDKFINKARMVVEANIGDCTFGVEAMAEEMNLSRTQLLRKIKALTGLSSSDFIRDIRLRRAAEMIRQRLDTITQIGYAVGFNDQSYFTKSFKKQYNVTPTEYAQAQAKSSK